MSRPDTSPPRALAGRGIRVECLSCGRVADLDEARVGGLPLVQITRQLRCSACGSGAVKAGRIDTPRDVAQLLRARMDDPRP